MHIFRKITRTGQFLSSGFDHLILLAMMSPAGFQMSHHIFFHF